MAVYRWIYANTENEALQKDYFVRLCDAELLPYKNLLIHISNHLIAARERNEQNKQKHCWLAGYLDEKLYVVGMAGEQEELLGTALKKTGSRNLFCTFLYAFTGRDIGIYKRESGLFGELKSYLLQLYAKTDSTLSPLKMEETVWNVYQEKGEVKQIAFVSEEDYNIQESTPEREERNWKNSLERPAALGILSLEEAKKLIDCLPNLCVTVKAERAARYYEGVTVKKEKKPEEARKEENVKKDDKEGSKKKDIQKEKVRKEKKKVIRKQEEPENPQNGLLNLFTRGYEDFKNHTPKAQEEKMQKRGKDAHEVGNRSYIKLKNSQKIWISQVLRERQDAESEKYYEDFLSMYLEQYNGGQVEKICRVIQKALQMTNGNSRVYYPKCLDSKEDVKQLLLCLEQSCNRSRWPWPLIEVNYRMATEINKQRKKGEQ
ncbi:MAG: hypothetical protein Q4D90_02940 [bacterium]|nr:hypothetical protein [bacterium]